MSFEYYCLSCGVIGDVDQYVDKVECPKCGGIMIPSDKKDGDTSEKLPFKETGHSAPQKHIKIARAVDTGFGGMLATTTDSLSKISPPKNQQIQPSPDTIKNGPKTKRKTFTIPSKLKNVKTQENETTALSEISAQKHIETRLNIHNPPFHKNITKTRIELTKKKPPVAMPLSETKEQRQKVKALSVETSADIAELHTQLDAERKARLEAEERVKQVKEEAEYIIAEEKAKAGKKAAEEAARSKRLAEEAALLAAKKATEKANAQIAEERKKAERKADERLKKEREDWERLRKELEEARKADEKFLQETVEKAIESTALSKPEDESAGEKDVEHAIAGKEPEKKKEDSPHGEINKKTGVPKKSGIKGLPPLPSGEMKKSQRSGVTKTKTAISMTPAAKEKPAEEEKTLQEKISDYGVTHTGLLRMQNKKRTIIYTVIFSTMGIIVIAILLSVRSCQKLVSSRTNHRTVVTKPAAIKETVTRPNELDYREVAAKVKTMPWQSIPQIDEIIKVWKEFINKYPNSADNKYISNAKEQIKTMEDLKIMHTPSK